MINYILRITLVLMLGCNLVNAQKDTAKEAFLEKWKNSKTYLIQIAESVPSSSYNFAPTPKQMDFKTQLVHIAENMLWLGNTYFVDRKFDREAFKKQAPENKEDVVQLLKTAFEDVFGYLEQTSEDDLKITVDFFAGPKTKLQILNLLQDHVTHHRGQLVVYLNLLEIEPPKFVGW